MFAGYPSGLVVKNPPANARDSVQSLIWEDSTCLKASKLMCHNDWACALVSEPQLLSPCAATTEATLPEKSSNGSEKPTHHN